MHLILSSHFHKESLFNFILLVTIITNNRFPHYDYKPFWTLLLKIIPSQMYIF
jgi:hypothetical protein